MLTDQQRRSLDAIERGLTVQDRALARAFETMSAPVRVSRARRFGQWLTITLALLSPLLAVAVLTLVPLPVAAAIGLLVTATIGLRCAGRRGKRGRRGPGRR
jgi:hypothetical protein